MRRWAAILALALFAGCGKPDPGMPLSSAKLAEGPVLIERDDTFYLRYRLQRQALRPILICDERGGNAYFYWSSPISTPDYGQLIEFPLAYEGWDKYVRAGRVFWLDPDGTTHSIPIRKE